MQDTKTKSRNFLGLPSWLGLFWVIQNFLSRIGGWAISSIRPIKQREHLIPSWPPQKPIFLWLERIWFAPLERWDVPQYIFIATAGYSSDNGSAQFHPLYPLVATPLTYLGISPFMSLVVISTLASFITIWLMYILALLDLEKDQAVSSVLLLFCSPFAFALFIPYSESLFILCAILSLFWARKKRWWLSGLCAAMATLTRQQGIFLVLPILWEFWESNNLSLKAFFISFRFRNTGLSSAESDHPEDIVTSNGYALLLAPAAYTFWVVFRAVVVNDVSFEFTSLNAFIYSLLISPHAVRVVPVQKFMFPWNALWLGIQKLILEPDADIIANLIWGLYFLILLGLSWKHLRNSYKIYCLVTTCISFAYYTGPLHPYMGLVRHLLLGFPVFIGLAKKLESSAGRMVVTGIGLIGYFHLTLFYTLRVWVP
jgi:hypothetical protein